MNILGLAFGFHDASAALLRDGAIICAAAEERFTRRKHDAALPARAIAFCLAEGGLTPSDLDAVVLHEHASVKFDRVVHAALRQDPPAAAYVERTVAAWIAQGKFDPAGRVAAMLRIPADRIHAVEHHAAHAASAFFASPFHQATVVTMDGVGEYEAITVSAGREGRLEKLDAVEVPHSLGLFYSAFTAFLGFEVNEGEYKVMGMAAFGQPRFANRIRPLLRLDSDGRLMVDERYFEFLTPEDTPFTPALVDLLGPPRVPESDVIHGHYADVAASVQLVVEEAIFHVVEHAVRRTGIDDVCLAGGVALNSLANGKLQSRLRGRLYVQPAAGDGGASLGAALYHAHVVCGVPRLPETGATALLGKAYDAIDVEDALRRGSVPRVHRFGSEDDLLTAVAQHLADGAIVGLCRGRFEWGPRALGARSILANPALPDMQRIVNEKIKFREPFRPFAPAVLDHRANEYFDTPAPYGLHSPEYFMLSVATVKASHRHDIPAVTHVDGTARVQLVNRATNPAFHRLLELFEAITGVPILLNTSFNLRGEPVVASPWDALWTFGWSGLDVLVIGDVLVDKSELR